uniref:General secretion pathway protein E n=1 Tax=uncultured Desulfobacterium sp. TaxID=201089 RepID=E1YBH1_9BACT|nr:General secretion pathway protein E [uncultured Desulfobacterium sp.]
MVLTQILKNCCNVTDEDINKALKLRQELGGNVGQILVQIGAITDGQLTEALSKELRIPLYTEEWAEDEVVITYLEEKLSYGFLIKNNCLPVKIDHDNKIIQLVTNNPFNYPVFDYIFNKVGYSVQINLATEQSIKDFARNYISTQDKDFVSLTVGDDTEKLKEMAFEAPVIKFLNNLLSKAVETRSSDIHIESSEKTYRVRFRIDGILQDIDFLEEAFYLATVSRIKLLAGLDIAENRLPQDGKFTTKIASRFLDIRVSTMPTIGGGGVVMRLLYREKVSFDLEYLGLEADHKEIVVNLLSHPYGILLVTGPTGSGKTTTIYSMLTRLNSKERKIITIEDPVEYQLEGINQIQVKSEIGLTFASALRSILRHDPDIIMVGEIRDRETAEISIQSALTGHFVLSTLHTNDAPSSLFRLVEMGLPDYLLNASLVGVVAQRIVRKNCSYCSEVVDPPPDHILKEYGFNELENRFGRMLDGGLKFMRGKGCPHCAKTGYRGRIAVFELFQYTDELKEVFLKKMSLEYIRSALREKENFRILREDGILKVAKGLTTIEEVLRVC